MLELNTYRVEEHFGAKEALVANVYVNHVVVDSFVLEVLEF